MNPDTRSIVEKYFAPANSSKNSSIIGRGTYF
jgi:hypothetical protein